MTGNKRLNLKRRYMNLRSITIFCFLLLSVFIITDSKAINIVSGRLRVKHNVECYIPYLSSLPLEQENKNITHLIIGLHDVSHCAEGTYNCYMKLLEKHNKLNDDIMLIIPQFLVSGHVNNNNEKNLLYWGVSPFFGSCISTTKAFEGDLRISAYKILEDIIADFCSKENFPNLKRITIVGHSAGGQMANRFAASNTIEFDTARPQNVNIRYIVMNPSSYVYMSPKRTVNWSIKNFAIPSKEEIAEDL